MADTPELGATQMDSVTQFGSQTTRISNPRVEIDTSPPFGSVKEAVTHFESSGSWSPLHVLRLAAHHGVEEFDMDKVEKQAAELEKDLILKEQETLEVLRELESAKRIVDGLKLSLMKEVSAFMQSLDLSPDCQMSTPSEKSVGSLSLCPVPSPTLILMELNEAKLNLNNTTNDLANIRASVESLNKKMRKEKILLGKNGGRPITNSAGVLSIEEDHGRARVKMQTANNAKTKGGFENSMNISRELQEFDFEAAQFRNMEDAARYEVMKATSEIEQTKTSIKMVEMRLIAAKKIEEAARAMEAVALAERKAQPNDESSSAIFMQKPEGITLSFEEYSALTQKAHKAEELSKKEVVDANAMHHVNEANLSKEAAEDVKHSKKSLEEVLGKENGTFRRKFAQEEGFCRGRSEHGQVGYSTHNSAKIKYTNSHSYRGHRDSQPLDGDESNLIKDKPTSVFRSTISIGDILSRKLILQDDIVVGKHMESRAERQEVSLSQMLREQSGLILHSPKAVKAGSVDKQFFAQRKKFGFIHVSLPLTKQSKKKSQVLNMI